MQDQYEAILKYWDNLTPEVRAKVWYYLHGIDLEKIGDSTNSMGEQALADHVAQTLSLETLYDMVSYSEFKATPAQRNVIGSVP